MKDYDQFVRSLEKPQQPTTLLFANLMANANHHREYTKTINLWKLWGRTRPVKISHPMISLTMKAHAELGQHDDMFKLFQDSLPVYGVKPTVRMYNVLFHVYGAVQKKVPAVLALLDHMSKNEVKANLVTYTTLIKMFKSLGDVPNAEKMFKKALSERFIPDAFLFSLMLELYGSSGDFKKAESFYLKMVETGFMPNEIVLKSLLKIYQKVGDLSKAEAIYQRLTKTTKPDKEIFNILIDLHKKAGNNSRVSELLDEMIKHGQKPDEVTCNTILDMYAKAGQCEEAKIIFEKMTNFGLKPDKYTLHIMAGVEKRLRDSATKE